MRLDIKKTTAAVKSVFALYKQKYPKFKEGMGVPVGNYLLLDRLNHQIANRVKPIDQDIMLFIGAANSILKDKGFKGYEKEHQAASVAFKAFQESLAPKKKITPASPATTVSITPEQHLASEATETQDQPNIDGVATKPEPVILKPVDDPESKKQVDKKSDVLSSVDLGSSDEIESTASPNVPETEAKKFFSKARKPTAVGVLAVVSLAVPFALLIVVSLPASLVALAVVAVGWGAGVAVAYKTGFMGGKAELAGLGEGGQKPSLNTSSDRSPSVKASSLDTQQKGKTSQITDGGRRDSVSKHATKTASDPTHATDPQAPPHPKYNSLLIINICYNTQMTQPNNTARLDYNYNFDVIIIGGGHAGTEAAAASARMGARTLLLTHNIETIGQMSCNPAIGGIGKGHLTKEIDALGGVMAKAIDRAGIHFRTLNASKGFAVRSTRAQADRNLYKQAVRGCLESQDNLFFFQQAVEDLIVEKDTVVGVITQMGVVFRAAAVVVATGTFLGGKIHIGGENYRGGRAGDPPSIALADRLRALPFRVERLKTGTPARIDGRTIDFSQLQAQPSDEGVLPFSFIGDIADRPAQVPCFLTDTNEKTHEIIRAYLHQSPMFSGQISGTGPRYCPSIEDKVVRFADRTSHRIFIEPEGLHTHEIYPNGISTSLPFEAQIAFIRSIQGFEKAHMTRPGYAIEYDFFDPRDLNPWLETKLIKRLFFAGQINGTTGYEEAAAQGLLAGVNAALLASGSDAWYPKRHEAYLGVLVDDLITRGTKEPYRMFTSRAEYRLILREDNADLRLTPIARKLGLIDDHRWQLFSDKKNAIDAEKKHFDQTRIHPDTQAADNLQTHGLINDKITRDFTLTELLKRPNITYHGLSQALSASHVFASDPQVQTQVEIQAKYAGYIERQDKEIAKHARHENAVLPQDIDYLAINALSHEVRQKLHDVKPQTIAQAARIPGVTPAAMSLLLVYVKSKGKPS